MLEVYLNVIPDTPLGAQAYYTLKIKKPLKSILLYRGARGYENVDSTIESSMNETGAIYIQINSKLHTLVRGPFMRSILDQCRNGYLLSFLPHRSFPYPRRGLPFTRWNVICEE
jgi:hypothetical protein